MNKIREILHQVREYITAAPNAEYTGENILALLDRIEEQLEQPQNSEHPAQQAAEHIFEERVEATAKEWPAWKRNALGPIAGVKRR